MAAAAPRRTPITELFPRNQAPPRRLVLCLDGTANGAFTERRLANGMKIVKPTNVLKLARAVIPWDASSRRDQVVYYDTGVGSLGLHPGLPNWALRVNDNFWGGLGAGFEANVEEALHFLALNYRPGDEIFVFGFSRGAATAQALTRFLDWSGGLPEKSDAYFLPHLFRSFLKFRAEVPVEQAIQEIDSYTHARGKALQGDDDKRKGRGEWSSMKPLRPVRIQFLGLWDTVMALGSRIEAVGETTSDKDNGFYRTPEPAECVVHARHAIAVDERRFDFRPEIWQRARAGQTLKQRWFPGVHSNVGGSYPRDGLANIAFHWMLTEAEQVGLRTDPTFTRHYKAFPLAQMYESYRWFYRLFDVVRLRAGKGRRRLVGLPGEANVEVDPSVIERMLWRPTKGDRSEIQRAYRPKNVFFYLACQVDLRSFLVRLGCSQAVADEFLQRFGKDVVRLKHDCSRHAPKPVFAEPAAKQGIEEPIAH